MSNHGTALLLRQDIDQFLHDSKVYQLIPRLNFRGPNNQEMNATFVVIAKCYRQNDMYNAVWEMFPCTDCAKVLDWTVIADGLSPQEILNGKGYVVLEG